jgi:ribosomal-protein-alanine N-acetyltransferase
MTDDLDRIMTVMSVAFDPTWGEAWTRRQVADSLAFPHTHYTLIAEHGGEPAPGESAAGFTLVRAAPGEEELLLIAVVPEHRGRGLGLRLLERFASDARARGAERIFLEMRSNNPAYDLYRALGFEPIGTRRNYYRRPDGNRIDAITFAKSL